MRKFLSILMCVVVLFSLTTTVALATEVKDANVTIHITDETSTYKKTVKVDFFNAKDGQLIKSIELSKANCWGNTTGYKFSIPTVSIYSLIFGELDGVEIVDTFTRAPIATFSPEKLTNDLYWSLITKEEEVKNEDDKKETSATATDRNDVIINNQEAEEVYLKFLEAVSFIEHDESWYNTTGMNFHATLEQYNEDSLNHKTYSSWYEQYVEGGTKEKFFEMSKYERFLWTETYTRFAAKIHENFDVIFADEASFRNQIINIVVPILNGDNKETVAAAYEELAMWQYHYIKENGGAYNFINNRSYLEEMKEKRKPITESNSEKTEEEEIQDTLDELTKEEKAEVADKKDGIWTDTLDILADNAITILIIIALAIGVGIAFWVKNHKNMDD